METIYDKAKCEICGKVFSGEAPNLQAEKCKESHEKIVISIWDFELPGLINYFNSHERSFLPKDFLKKLRNLQGRALRSG